MRARLETVPADKFPNLYMALHRQNRTNAIIRRVGWSLVAAAILGLGILIGVAL